MPQLAHGQNDNHQINEKIQDPGAQESNGLMSTSTLTAPIPEMPKWAAKQKGDQNNDGCKDTRQNHQSITGLAEPFRSEYPGIEV